MTEQWPIVYPWGDSEAPSVDDAWTAVMREVPVLTKGRTSEGGRGMPSFQFRGIDDLMAALGPAMRRWGVKILPGRITDRTSETYSTKSGTTMRNISVTREFVIRGPRGDMFPAGEMIGEAADAGDKATSKAQSVALRLYGLQALMVPTGDADPDSYTHERAAPDPALDEANEARGDMLTLLQPYDWTPEKLIRRFKDDYGADLLAADTATVRAFASALEDEAKAQDA